jgi:SAM-dependent methyltransferase
MSSNEVERIQLEYARRDSDGTEQRRYSILQAENLYFVQSRERALIALLRRQRFFDLAALQILDVGCGAGGELLRWIGYGAVPANCVGIDLVPERVVQAKGCLSSSTLVQQGNAAELPFDDNQFEIVYQYTMFSSILDVRTKQKAANEMLRVLRPNGMIIWYDFWLNPINPQTRGIRLSEIKSLFPDCLYDHRLITLAPPLARVIAPRSMIVADLLEKFSICTHWLVGIRKASS